MNKLKAMSKSNVIDNDKNSDKTKTTDSSITGSSIPFVSSVLSKYENTSLHDSFSMQSPSSELENISINRLNESKISSSEVVGNSEIILDSHIDEKIEYDEENGSSIKKSIKVDFSLESINDYLTKSRESRIIDQGLGGNFYAKIAPDQNAAAETELRKSLSRENFKKVRYD